MNNIGAQQYTPNGYGDLSGTTGRSEVSQATGSQATGSQATGSQATGSQATGSQATGSQANGSKHTSADGMTLDNIFKVARNVQAKVKDIPYIVPVTVGSVAFVLGVLASSRILRQLVLVAGAYTMKLAIQNAPKDEILDFTKKFVKDAIRNQATA